MTKRKPKPKHLVYALIALLVIAAAFAPAEIRSTLISVALGLLGAS